MSVEKDIAFLEDYQFMLATGESHDTAATRFGCSPNSLEKRVWRATDRLRRAGEQAGSSNPSTKLKGSKNGPIETLARLAGPTHSLATAERG